MRSVLSSSLAYFAAATTALKPAGSKIAMSAMILRSMATPFLARPAMSFE